MVKTKLFNWIGGKKWLSKELNELYSKALMSKAKYTLLGDANVASSK